MAGETAIRYIWDGVKIVDAIIHYPTAASTPPTATEKEVVRIIKERNSLQSRLETAEGALEFAKNNNPYPESVFTEPTKKQYARFHEILKSEGLTLDKFSGSIGRRIWNVLVEKLEHALTEGNTE